MLIRGTRLTTAQRKQVLASFVHRHTVECPFYTGVTRRRPTITDEEWLAAHAFHFTTDGSRLTRHAYCEPACFADHPINLP